MVIGACPRKMELYTLFLAAMALTIPLTSSSDFLRYGKPVNLHAGWYYCVQLVKELTPTAFSISCCSSEVDGTYFPMP